MPIFTNSPASDNGRQYVIVFSECASSGNRLETIGIHYGLIFLYFIVIFDLRRSQMSILTNTLASDNGRQYVIVFSECFSYGNRLETIGIHYGLIFLYFSHL